MGIFDFLKQKGSNNDKTIELAKAYIDVIGGKDNIEDIDACITRLRLTLKDSSVVTEEKVRALGASGLIRPSKTTVQIIVGTQAEIIAEEMKSLV